MKSVLILLVVFFVVRSLKKHLEGRQAQKSAQAPPAPPKEATVAARRDDAEEMALDPVCGSYVPLSAAVKSTNGGRAVYFCSEECRMRFTQEEP